MDTALVEKLHRTYMFIAKWRKEMWLKVERIMGAQRVPETHRLVKCKQHKTHMYTCGRRLTGGGVREEVLDHIGVQ